MEYLIVLLRVAPKFYPFSVDFKHVGSLEFDVIVESVLSERVKQKQLQQSLSHRCPSLLLNQTTHLTSAFSADCHDSVQRNRQEGKLLTQVCALKVKHFHLCNQIAEQRQRQLHRSAEQDSQRPWGAHKMVDGHATDTPVCDWLCLLGH